MKVVSLFIFFLVTTQPCLASSAIRDFDDLLQESGLVFNKPDKFEDLPAGSNDVLNYERAILSPDRSLEIRIAVRPLKRMKIEYIDPHGAVPDPNHIFPLVFESLVSRLSAGRYSPSREYSVADAKKYFNADWAAAAIFDTSPDFNTQFNQGVALALHRTRVSDAYVIFLFNDYAKVKPVMDQAMTSLVFSEAGQNP